MRAAVARTAGRFATNRSAWSWARAPAAIVVGGLLEAAIALVPADWHDRAPGAAVALGILVAVLAGWVGGAWAGLVVAAVGWAFNFVYVADEAAGALWAAPVWLATAVGAGLAADRLRRGTRERHLLANELNTVLASSSEAIVRLTAFGTISGWSPGAERLYGYTADEAIGERVSILLPETPTGAPSPIVERVVRAEPISAAEAVHRRKDGSEVSVCYTICPLRDGAERPVGAALLARDIGERKELEARLSDTEWKHRALVGRLPVVVYTHALDARGSPLDVGPQVDALLGYSREEWLAEPELFVRLLHPDDRERVVGERASARRENKPLLTEYRMLARDGHVVWLRDEAATVRDAEGRPAYRQGSLLDVSWRRRGEEEREALRAAEKAATAGSRRRQRRLDFLADASGVLAASLDYETTLRRVAELAVRELADWCVVDVLGEDGTLGRVAGAYRSPRDAPRGPAPAPEPEAAIHRVVQSGLSESVPSVNGHENGAGRSGGSDGLPFATYVCVPLVARGRSFGALTLASETDGAGYGGDDLALAEDLARRMAVAIDNARLHREVEARADAERVLTYVGDGIVLVDRGGVIRLWNSAAETITGLPASSVTGRPATEAIPGWPSIVDRIPVATSPEPSDAATMPIDSERGELWLSISGVEFFGGTVYAFRDVTEAHRLDELKAEFVATASHELRTPLAAVYGAAQTLRRHDFALDEAGRERFVSLIVDESERLSRIVNEILLANQLDAGRIHVATDAFDPVDLIERVVEGVGAHAPATVTIEVVADPEVPAVAADRDKVRQVLVNLIENAVKYSPQGGTIQVGIESEEDAVCFFVRDEGLGIPGDEQGRIFEKFYRLDPAMRRGIGGTGLGLYICHELVSRMDGRIWVESSEGRGSTFYFELPLAETAPTRTVGVDGEELRG